MIDGDRARIVKSVPLRLIPSRKGKLVLERTFDGFSMSEGRLCAIISKNEIKILRI